MTAKPVVALSCDVKVIEPHPYQCVGDKYARAVLAAADCLPVLLPALADAIDPDQWLSLIDGLVLTGSYANVHPKHYGGDEPRHDSPLDPARDAANLSMIPLALERGIPLLGICRGFQEINVALGGSLHQHVHELPDYDHHLEDPEHSTAEQYGPAHPVTVVAGGLLAGLSDHAEHRVNSLHGQGVDELAPGLTVEAVAPDGLIEAFSVADAKSFALAVQWHPEWRPHEHPFYAAIWRAFGTACKQHAQRRQRSVAA